MQTFISDLIPKVQRYSQKLDDLTLLTNQHWVVIDETDNSKNVYIFRKNNELLISSNGEVEKGKWEYLGNNSLLIDRKNKSYLFKHGFFDENILALKIDGKNEYAFLINENKFQGELNTLDKINEFLAKKYIEPEIEKSIEVQYKIQSPKIIGETPEQLKKADEELQKFYDNNAKVIMGALLFTMLLIGLIILFSLFGTISD